MLPVFRDVDASIDMALEREARTGLVPSCRGGCSHCCHQRVHASAPEAAAVADFVMRTFSAAELNALVTRLDAWQSWVDNDLMWQLERGLDEGEAFAQHGPRCPLLVDDNCSVYPVRPFVCRAHYVTSDPRACRPRRDPEALDEPVLLMDEVVAAVKPVARRLRSMIEASGQPFENAVALLPAALRRALEARGPTVPRSS